MSPIKKHSIWDAADKRQRRLNHLNSIPGAKQEKKQESVLWLESDRLCRTHGSAGRQQLYLKTR